MTSNMYPVFVLMMQCCVPAQVPDPDNDMDDEELEILHEDIENDFDMGDVIRSKLIPDAVRW